MEKIPLENLEGSDQSKKEQKKVSFSEKIKAIEKNIADLKGWMGIDGTPSDREVLIRLKSELEELINKEEREREAIEEEYNNLFSEIIAMKEVVGSTRTYTAEEVINKIKKVIDKNRLVKAKINFVVGIEEITRTADIRDRVEKLILREMSL